MMSFFLSKIIKHLLLKELFLLLLCSFAVTIGFSFLAKWFAVTIHCTSKEEHFIGPKREVPLLGGLGIYAAFFLMVTLVLFFSRFSLSKEILGFLVGGLLIVLLGLVDDLSELSPYVKFTFQVIFMVPVIYFSGLRTELVALPGFLNFIVTIIWIVGVINAFNLLDIIDGLSAGVALIAAIFFFIFSLISNNLMVEIVTAVFIGVLLGFLCFNFPPAKLFMGDCGSMFLGYVLSILAVQISYADAKHNGVVLVTPIVILLVPVLDTFFVALARFLKRKPIFKKGDEHFAFLLIKEGYGERKILMIFWLTSILSGVFAVLIYVLNSNLWGVLLLLSGLICFSIMEFFMYRKKSLNDKK